MIISGLIFLLIITNISQLYALIPDEYQISYSIVILISCVKLYDNLLGNNNSILFNSDYYRLVLAIGVFLAVLAFVLNILLIPVLELLGAALATFLAFACYNTVKLVIVQKKFKIHPFTRETGYSLLIILILAFGFYFWEFSWHPLVNIVLKSGIIALLYVLIIYLLKLSPDINKIIQKSLRLPQRIEGDRCKLKHPNKKRSPALSHPGINQLTNQNLFLISSSGASCSSCSVRRSSCCIIHCCSSLCTLGLSLHFSCRRAGSGLRGSSVLLPGIALKRCPCRTA